MYTICETTVFNRYYQDYWTEEEYNDFKVFLAVNPEAGAVEPGAGGIRKKYVEALNESLKQS